MQTNTFEREIIRDNIPSETNFTIKATGKAFRILSDGLYTDKILAIVRELSCNAYDAHVAAGNPEEPFHVQLPTPLDPTFRIRDYGIGLARQDVLHLYTTYFESTKTNSNDFIGALGLGSKSPFSLVDSFVVHSFFNGVKMSFTAFISELGIPSITQLGEEPTEERNGLEVVVPVANQYDFSVFRAKAETVYRGFAVKPTIVGAELKIKDFPTVVQGDGWRVIDARHEPYNSPANRAHAIQGNVVYPISLDSIPNCPSELTSLFSLPLEIRFPIGDLDVTASREALSMDQRTQRNILAKFSQIRKELRDQVSAAIESCDTPWNARLKFAQIRNINNSMAQLLGTSFMFHGSKFETSVELDFTKNPNLIVYRYSSGWKKPRQRLNEQPGKAEPFALGAAKDIALWVDDVGISANRRMDENNRHGDRYLFRFKLPSNISIRKEHLVREYVHGSKDLKLLKGRLGGAPIRFLSELPAPPRATVARRTGKVFAFDGQTDFFVKNYAGFLSVTNKSTSSKLKATWGTDDLDVADLNEIPYVVLESFAPRDYSADTFGRMYLLADQLKLFQGTALYGIRVRDADGLDDSYEFGNWLRDQVHEYTEKHKLSEKLTNNARVYRIENHFEEYLRFKRDTLGGVGLFSDLDKRIAEVKKIPLTENEQRVQDLARVINYTIPVTSKQDDVFDIYDQLIAKYPLLSTMISINNHGWNTTKFTKEQVKEYIEMVDKCQPTPIA